VHTDVDRTAQEVRAISSFRVKLRRVDRGPHLYSAHIYIDDEHYGYVSKLFGAPYEAFTRRNRLVATAENLNGLREKIIAQYVSEPSVSA